MITALFVLTCVCLVLRLGFIVSKEDLEMTLFDGLENVVSLALYICVVIYFFL